MRKDVWILAELKDGEPTDATLGLIGEGRRICRELAGGSLTALVLGPAGPGLGSSMGRHGVERVYVLEHESSAPTGPDVWANRIAGLAGDRSPLLLLLGATSLGSDLAPRISAKLKTALATRCVDLRVGAAGRLEFVRPVSNEMLHATIRPRGEGVHVATMAPEVMESAEPDGKKDAEVLSMAPSPSDRAGRLRTMEVIKGNPKTIALGEAEIVVAGGRGMGEERAFRLVHELAEAIGGSVGGSRPVVDAGLVPFEINIGRTGKDVSARIFVACGISGASEFSGGIGRARKIVAINIDKDAPIMKMADLGVVGDARKLIPEIVRLLGERKRSRRKAAGDPDPSHR